MSKHGLIYFLTDGEAIKIGFTTSAKKRREALQTSHYVPLFLLGSIPGTLDEERILHRRFGHLRLTGEWFRRSDEIFDLIDGFEDRGELIPGDNIDEYGQKYKLETDDAQR